MPTKKTIFDFQKMKRQGEKIALKSTYDYPTAQFAERVGIDAILVGDSLGNCIYGYPAGTIPVTADPTNVRYVTRHSEGRAV